MNEKIKNLPISEIQKTVLDAVAQATHKMKAERDLAISRGGAVWKGMSLMIDFEAIIGQIPRSTGLNNILLALDTLKDKKLLTAHIGYCWVLNTEVFNQVCLHPETMPQAWTDQQMEAFLGESKPYMVRESELHI